MAPTVGALTWVNQLSASATNADSLLTLTTIVNDATGGPHSLVKTATLIAGAFTFTLRYLPTQGILQFGMVGIALRESGTGKLLIWGPSSNTGTVGTADEWDRETWTNAAQTATGALTPSPNSTTSSFSVWQRFTFDGTNVKYYFSGDGETWMLIKTELATVPFTVAPDQIGISVRSFNANQLSAMSVISWVES